MKPYELHQVVKRFDQNVVLKGITLDIFQGETLVILGGSGTGKSVLLKLLIGLHRADSGRIIFDGTDITNLKETAYNRVRRRVSYLFQGGALFDSMNVFENLAYPLVAHKNLTREEIAPIVAQSLSLVELSDVEQLFPADLSGGMMKRVALARAIITQPEIILYDEPTTGLDPLTTHTINQLIRKMQRELNITSVVVTHDMSTAQHVGDRLAFLHNGTLEFTGTLKQAFQARHPMLQAYLKGRSYD